MALEVGPAPPPMTAMTTTRLGTEKPLKTAPYRPRNYSSDDDYYNDGKTTGGRSVKPAHRLSGSPEGRDDDNYGLHWNKAEQTLPKRSGGRYPIRWDDFSSAALAIHQKEAASVHALVTGKEAPRLFRQVVLPDNICQYEAAKVRHWLVAEGLRRLQRAHKQGLQLIALTLVVPEGLVRGEDLNAASIARMTRHFQRLLRKIPGLQFAIGAHRH